MSLQGTAAWCFIVATACGRSVGVRPVIIHVNLYLLCYQ